MLQERELEALRRRLSPQLRKWLGHQGIPDADHDDMLQDTFLALWWREDVANPPAFVRATLKNRVLNYWRRCYRHAEVSLESLGCEPEVGAMQMRAELRWDLERTVRQLPPRQRQIAVLKLDHGMSCAEIAALTSESVKAVANVWCRTLRKIKQMLRGAD